MNPPPQPSKSPTSAFPPHLSLSRYGSAPGSFITSLTDTSSVAAGGAPDGLMMRSFLSGEPSAAMSMEQAAAGKARGPPYGGVGEISLGHEFAGGGGGAGEQEKVSSGGGGSLLARHSSSPAGFFSNLMMDNGFSGSRAAGGADGSVHHAMANNRKLKSQLSFTRQSALSQISEDGIPDLGDSLGGGSHSDETGTGNVARSFSGGFSIGSWDDSNSIVFSAPAGKRGKDNNGDIIATLSNYDSQFSLPRTSLEMAGVENYLQIPQDQVPFKIRAKRGCATHPRSIAERERRTRISEKLRKLQDLVPNMDKQTSTADMLDLAVQHIKGLQSQLQTLKQEKEKCTCCSKQREELK